jgi:hypothetical protein
LQEEGEWVILPLEERYRVSKDGKRAQHRYIMSAEWADLSEENMAVTWPVQCYRAGLKVGREQARELAQAVLNFHDTPFPKAQERIDILALARKVKGE